MIRATFQSPRRISTRLQSRLAILTDEIRGTGIPLNLPGTRARRTIAGSRPSPGSPGSQGLGLDLLPAILGILRKSQESRVADPAWDPQEPQEPVTQQGSPGSQGLGLDLPPAILGILRKSQESRVADPAWDPQEPQQLVIQRPGWEVSRSIRTLTMESPR